MSQTMTHHYNKTSLLVRHTPLERYQHHHHATHPHADIAGVVGAARLGGVTLDVTYSDMKFHAEGGKMLAPSQVGQALGGGGAWAAAHARPCGGNCLQLPPTQARGVCHCCAWCAPSRAHDMPDVAWHYNDGITHSEIQVAGARAGPGGRGGSVQASMRAPVDCHTPGMRVPTHPLPLARTTRPAQQRRKFTLLMVDPDSPCPDHPAKVQAGGPDGGAPSCRSCPAASHAHPPPLRA